MSLHVMVDAMDLSGSELLIVLLVIVVLFGSTRLPKLARSLGEAQREFRRGVSHAHDDRDESRQPASGVPTTSTATPVAAPAPTAIQPTVVVTPVPVTPTPAPSPAPTPTSGSTNGG